MADTTPDVLLNLKQVCKRLDASKSFVYARVRAGEIPPPIHLAGYGRMSRWRSSWITKFIASREPADTTRAARVELAAR